jgi:c-di-GMP-binding flagellar brake protein YcgR
VLCAAQQILVPPGQHARRAFRVSVLFKVQLVCDEETFETVSVDVGTGGFGALVPHAPKSGGHVRFKMMPASSAPLEGTAEIVGTSARPSACRLALRFTTWRPGDAARLEVALFDAALARFRR